MSNPLPQWLLLLPQIPPQPSSLRVRVWRRLQQLGAVAVKNAAYALPNTETALEDFQWLAQEIVDAGGGVILLQANGLGDADEEIRELFRVERSGDYLKLGEEADRLAAAYREEKDLPPDLLGNGVLAIRLLRERHSQIRHLDFFESPAAAAATSAIDVAEMALNARLGRSSEIPAAVEASASCGKAWVTRRGMYVDRLACAWLIRRFVDGEARFITVDPEDAWPDEAIPFDLKGVEFGHHGQQCSMETMAHRFAPDDCALRCVAEVVHDLDFKDEGFGRPETAGLKRLLDGLCAGTSDDQERIRTALPLFEALYRGFQ